MTTTDYDFLAIAEAYIYDAILRQLKQLPQPVTGGLVLDVPHVQDLDCVPVRIEVADSFWTLRGVRRVGSGVELVATYECYRVGRFT